MASPNVQILVKELAMIDDFLIDCLMSDNHTFPSEVTKFPVESGSTISDNIRNEPMSIVMDCVVSNSPIGQLRDLRKPKQSPFDSFVNPLGQASVNGNRVDEPADAAYDMLMRVRAARVPVTIRTSLRTYSNMALQNLSIPRDAGRGDDLRFTATFQQIEIVVNKRGKRVAIPSASEARKFGTTTADKAIAFQALAPKQLTTFFTHPDRVSGQVALATTKVQAANLANSADLDRRRAATQNLGQRVNVRQPTVTSGIPTGTGF